MSKALDYSHHKWELKCYDSWEKQVDVNTVPYLP